jgi:hypothetical protein
VVVIIGDPIVVANSVIQTLTTDPIAWASELSTPRRHELQAGPALRATGQKHALSPHTDAASSTTRHWPLQALRGLVGDDTVTVTATEDANSVLQIDIAELIRSAAVTSKVA